MARITNPPYEPLVEESKIVPANLSWITTALNRLGLSGVKPVEYLVTQRSITLRVTNLKNLMNGLLQVSNIAPTDADIAINQFDEILTVSWSEKVLNGLGSNETR